MRNLLRLLKPHWFWMVLAPVAMFIEARMDLQQPLFMSRIVDEGVAACDPEAIRAIGWKMLAFAFFGSLGGCACTVFSSFAALGFGDSLRRALFSSSVRLSFSQVDRFTAGSLTTRMTNDVSTLQFTVVMFTRMLLRTPMLLCGSVWLVVSTDWRLSVPLLVSAPVLSWLVVRFMRRMIPLFRERQARTDALSSAMQESLAAIRVVKAFASEDFEEARFAGLNEALFRTDFASGILHSALGPCLGFVQHLTGAAIIFIAARDADAGLVKVGEVAAVVNWATQVMMSLVMLSFHVMHFSRAMISARRVAEVLDSVPEIRDGADDSPVASGSVRFNDVTFRYESGGRPVLEHVSFSVAPGERLAVVGGTGSGKTTLLSLIARFHDVSGGSVEVGGEDVRNRSLKALRSSMGIVLQNPALFSGSIADNIRWGDPGATDGEVRAAAATAQADGFISAFPDGYATSVAQGGVTLSGGQKQRVAIARALLRRPKILLLDDAASAVDPATERALRTALDERARGVTVITVTQRVASVRDADRILVLDHGRMAGFGTHDELLASCAEYREMADSQET